MLEPVGYELRSDLHYNRPKRRAERLHLNFYHHASDNYRHVGLLL